MAPEGPLGTAGPGGTPRHSQLLGRALAGAGRPPVELQSSAGLRNTKRFLQGVTLHLTMSSRVLVEREVAIPPHLHPPSFPLPRPLVSSPGDLHLIRIFLVSHPEQAAAARQWGNTGAAAASGHRSIGEIQIIVSKVL